MVETGALKAHANTSMVIPRYTSSTQRVILSAFSMIFRLVTGFATTARRTTDRQAATQWRTQHTSRPRLAGDNNFIAESLYGVCIRIDWPE